MTVLRDKILQWDLNDNVQPKGKKKGAELSTKKSISNLKLSSFILKLGKPGFKCLLHYLLVNWHKLHLFISK